MRCKQTSHGFTIVDLLVILVAFLMLLAVVMPALAQNRNMSGITTSLANLVTLGHAHRVYANEWDDRQLSMTAYDLTDFVSFSQYETPSGEPHPPLTLGWGPLGDVFGLWDYNPTNGVGWPIHGIDRFGWFRVPNFQALHKYVNGKFYDPTYYAPNDTVPYLAASIYFDEPYEFIGEPTTIPGMPEGGIETPFWSSYCLSPAALFSQRVFARRDCSLYLSISGMLEGGFETPAISHARYPSLKTQIIEHNWVQNPPAFCNPGFSGGTYDGCEPYYFNHGFASSPATLFYDGSVRLLPNTETLAADEILARTAGGGTGLWFSPGDNGFTEAGNLVTDGYFLGAGYDKIDIGYHILTIDGILGRDTLGR